MHENDKLPLKGGASIQEVDIALFCFIACSRVVDRNFLTKEIDVTIMTYVLVSIKYDEECSQYSVDSVVDQSVELTLYIYTHIDIDHQSSYYMM